MTRKKIFRFRLFIAVALGLAGFFMLAAKPALAANPTTINFQGKVVNSNGTNVSDGTYSFVFRIYNTSSPGPTTACSSDASCLFEETQSTVTVTNGTFQVELGSTCTGGLVASNSCTKSAAGGLNFSSNNALYLTLQFSGDTSGTHGGFMWPVISLTSVPYAYYADNSGALNGLSSGNFVQLAQGVQTDTSTTNPSIFVNKNNASDTPNILQLQKSSSDVLVVANTGALTVTPSGDNIGTTFRQTSGTATSGDVFNIQTSNGTSDFLQVTNAAANEGSVTVQSVGATRGLTLNSSNGTIVLGSATTTFQKSGAVFTIDVSNGASNSELDIANSGGTGNVTLRLDTGGIFAIGSTTGSTISVCGANNYVSSFAATGGLVSGGSCATIASSNLSDTSNIALLNAANTFAPTANNSGTTVKQTSGTATSGNIFDVQAVNGTSHFITVANSAVNEGAVTIQSLGATRDLNLVAGSGTISLGTTTNIDSANGLTVQGGTTLSLLSATTNNITVDSGTTGSVIIGATNNTNGKNVAIGNNNASSTVDIDGGTAATAIEIGDTSTAHGIKIGANVAGVQTVVIGNAVTSSSLALQAGSGNASLNVTSGTITLQTTTSGQINLTPAASSNVVIGASNTTGEILVLDTDTDATFNAGAASNTSTEANGGMFYSSADHVFMCGIAGSWLPCSGLLESNTSAPTAVASCTTACAAYGAHAPIPANYCQVGRTIHVIARGVWSSGSGANASTIQFGLFYGTDGTTRGNDVQIGASTLASVSVTSAANYGWSLDYTVICFSTTSMNGQGNALVGVAASGTNVSPVSSEVLFASTTTSSTVASTSAKNLYIFPTYSASQASVSSQLQQLIVTGN